MNPILAAALLLSSPTQAASVLVNGRPVEAKNVSYYAGSNQVHSLELVAPTTISFARGNSLELSETIYLHQNGQVSAAATSKPKNLEWRLANNKILSLDCRPKPGPTGDLMARLISFHNNGEYKAGCATHLPADLSAGNQEVTVFGEIDLSASGKLVYGQKVSSSRLRLSVDQEVRVFISSELAFYENGAPNFFTLMHGESFRANQRNLGNVAFQQKEGKHASTVLFADGAVERGILAQELAFPLFELSIPASSGVAFTERGVDLAITSIYFSAAQTLRAEGQSFPVSRIALDPESGLYEALVNDAFTYRTPEGETLSLPANCILLLTDTRVIVSIRTPRGLSTLDGSKFGL